MLVQGCFPPVGKPTYLYRFLYRRRGRMVKVTGKFPSMVTVPARTAGHVARDTDLPSYYRRRCGRGLNRLKICHTQKAPHWTTRVQRCLLDVSKPLDCFLFFGSLSTFSALLLSSNFNEFVSNHVPRLCSLQQMPFAPCVLADGCLSV
jgi:hypothetical protein